MQSEGHLNALTKLFWTLASWLDKISYNYLELQSKMTNFSTCIFHTVACMKKREELQEKTKLRLFSPKCVNPITFREHTSRSKFLTWLWRRRFLDKWSKAFHFCLQHFHGTVGVWIVNHVTNQLTGLHLVVWFGARWGRFVPIHAQYNRDCDETSFKRQTHFDDV